MYIELNFSNRIKREDGLKQPGRVEKTPKQQIPNNKQFPMTKISNSKPVLVIEDWIL